VNLIFDDLEKKGRKEKEERKGAKEAGALEEGRETGN
jgi:hypothetical protein